MSAAPHYVPSPTPDLARIERALISVSDKEGLVELGKALAAHGVEILSTGGSAKALRDAGLKVVEVSDHTGFPEIMDGRVKTLQPTIHGGILARRTDAGHKKAMADHKIAGIDLVVVNLYPFEATVARGADFPTCVENIDIGGPALIRASAKNHDFVTIVVDPADYAAVIAEMKAHQGATTLALRRKLAAKAYARTASYDAAIASWFAKQAGRGVPRAAHHHRRARADPALRREPASAGRLLFRRQQAAGRRHGARRAGQGAFLQQHRRHRGGLRVRGRVQGAGGRRGQARQSLRRGRGRGSVQRLPESLCLRSGVDLRRHRRRQHDAGSQDRRGSVQALPRSRDRARRDARGAGDLRQEEERARAAGRHPARSAVARHDHAQRGRRLPAAEPRQRPSRQERPEGRHQARADSEGARRPACSPSPSAST